MNTGILVAILGALIILISVFYVGEGGITIFSDKDVTVEEGLEGEQSSSGDNKETTQTTQKSTTAKKSAPVKSSPTTSSVPVNSTGADYVIVLYTNDGFVPAVAEVEGGKSIRFWNKSDKPLWITSENHPTLGDQGYVSFRQSKSIYTGDTFEFTFTRLGVWGYYNLNNDKHLGAVSVIKQK